MNAPFIAYDHVQLAMPKGEEAKARVRVETFEDGVAHGYIADPFGNRIELTATR